jgi:ATP-dependent DNA helicase DinG
MLSKFPKPYKPYPHQIPVLEQLDEAIKNKTKFIIVQAPTGSGKSMFAGALANSTKEASNVIVNHINNNTFFNKSVLAGYQNEEEILNEESFGSFTLTVSKQLQTQYTKLFDAASLLKGRVNYACTVDDSFTCEISPCHLSTKTMSDCIKEKKCPFINARNACLKSKFSVLNYNMFLCLPDFAKRRQIIICDEATELEDQIIDHHSVTINYSELQKFYKINIKKLLVEDRHKGRLWLLDLHKQVKDVIKDESGKIGGKQSAYLNKKEFQSLFKLKKLVRLQDSLITVINNWHKAEYIIERIEDGVTFTPLCVNNLTNCIFDFADHVILMSATIIDHKTFADTLGIKEYKYIEAESTFDPAKSPIFCPGKHMLNFANINKNLDKVAKQVIEICNQHPNEKGIIHTHSFKITEAIQRLTKGQDRFLFREAGVNNEMLLDSHFENSTNSVIVSPSLGYGTDLIGEHGRFQIIVKLPYLPLGSKRIKTLANQNFKWYNMKMLISLIQMSGRCTRSKEDESVTYILDGQAVSTLKKNWNALPMYFRARLK